MSKKVKNLVFIMAGVSIMLLCMMHIFTLQNKINEQEKTINTMNSEIIKLNEHLNDGEIKLNEQNEIINNLYSNVYNLKNGEAYEIEIKHNDATIIYKNNGKLFSSEEVITIR